MMDLNLLIVANSLYQHKNVSTVARELGLSQPAVSHALGRLRDHYGDPLFVRVSKGVAPTPFALSIQADIRKFVDQALMLSRKQDKFEPSKAVGRVVISSTDYFEVVVLSKLLAHLQKVAPGIQVSLRPLKGGLPKAELESGEFDFAIAGYFGKLPEGFYRVNLFEETFSVALRKGHPFEKSLNEKNYMSGRHAHVAIKGDFVDDLDRKQYYGSFSFTGHAWSVSKTDLILTAPTRLLKECEKYFPIVVKPCPIQIDSMTIQMVWHELSHQEPMKKWFREQLKHFASSHRE